MAVHRTKRRTKIKADGPLKGLTSARKSNTVLLKDIQVHIVEQAIKRGQSDREPHKMHVSEVIKPDWCPRQAAYKIHKVPPSDVDETINHRSEQFFDTGHEAHKKWQDWLWSMGVQFGTWKCLHCELIWDDTSPPCCPECGSKALEYKEVQLEAFNGLLVGHGDGAHDGLNAIIEIKGLGVGTLRMDDPALLRKHTVKVEGEDRQVVDVDALFKDLSRPLRSHLLQVQMYLWMAREMGLPYDKAIFIYESKANQATKEFVVPFSQRLVDPIIDKVWKMLLGPHSVPPRPAGFEKDSKPCSTCLFRTHCWEEDVAEESTPGEPVPTGAHSPGGRGETAGSGDQPASSASDGVPGDPGRHHRDGGQGSDDPVHPTGEVPGVLRDSTSPRRSGRTLYRGRGRENPGPQEPREQ